MKDEAEKIPMTAKLLSQEQALRRLNKNAESKQQDLTELWASYSRADNPISSKELLEALGNLTHKFSRAQLRELRNANGLDESD
jgi:dihydrodipicolinate synthase/N-acetylneuraminate lyase